ncbi:MAG: heme ABC transporter ATP-binding protein [Alphaproteobacteria bacterium]|nr:heme ABC transporter ATP-binding protein [Alphaproteobacteria bacterium]
MITADNIGYKIRNNIILENVSAQIENGKITAIIGPNGAGKTTLLKCLTGAYHPNAGVIKLDDKPLTHYSLDILSRKRAVLSQSNPINFPFTTLEIVMMGRNPYVKNNTAANDMEVALAALESVDALHLKERIFPTLSGGEQQRVQLARVLAQLWEQETAYLFLDEPTSALDLKHQHQFLSLVCQLAQEKQFAVSIIMHDLALAMRYTDHVLLLKNGKLFAAGLPLEVIHAKNIENVFEVPADFVFANRNEKPTQKQYL